MSLNFTLINIYFCLYKLKINLSQYFNSILNLIDEFDLLPDTVPVSITPYRMALKELTKLKAQLQEFLELGVYTIERIFVGSTCIVCEKGRHDENV